MMEIMDKGFSAKMGADKGQLISKCPFGVIVGILVQTMTPKGHPEIN